MDKAQAMIMAEKHLPRWIEINSDTTLEDAVCMFLIQTRLNDYLTLEEALSLYEPKILCDAVL